MLPLFFVGVFLVQAHAAFKCDEEIRTEILTDFDQMVGNWTHVYHWDNLDEESSEEYGIGSKCASVEITLATAKFIEDKKQSCNSETDFDWERAKYKFVAPELGLENSVICDGKNSAIMEDCWVTGNLEVRMIDDYLTMINNENGIVVEMLSRKIPRYEELNCLAENLDFAKKLSGFALCYEENL